MTKAFLFDSLCGIVYRCMFAGLDAEGHAQWVVITPGEEPRTVKDFIEAEDFDNQKQYVVYQMLVSGKTLSPADVKEVKTIAKELLERLQVLTAGIDDWRSKNAAKAQVRKKIRDTLYELLPEGLRSDEERAAFEERVYNYYYQLPDAA